MTEASDGPQTGPVEEPVPQTRRPPVPGAVPPDEPGRHRTEQVPFPLPPLPPMPAAPVPAPTPGPATGQLDRGGYPPRVPGRPGGTPADDGSTDDR